MECKCCGIVIREDYEFVCLSCGYGPMCDACYYDHVVGDHHVERVDEEEEEKQ